MARARRSATVVTTTSQPVVQQVVEVLPAAAEVPLHERVARALVQQADTIKNATDGAELQAVLSSAGCTFEQYVGLTMQPEFMAAIQRYQHARDLPNLIAARSAVIGEAQGGNAYALKTAHDTAFKDDLEGDDKAFVEAMVHADPRVLEREIRKAVADGILMLERVTGRPYFLSEALPSPSPQ